jgi:hypothetical protein
MRTSIVALLALGAFTACNEPPGAPTVAIEPAEPLTEEALTAVIVTDSVDPNKNDTVTYSYVWTVDGTVVPDISGPEVSADRTTRGEVWAVTVTPADDKEPGATASAAVTVGNTAPTATASITPATPLSSDDLTLAITSSDADGDTVNTSITWTVDGNSAGISSARVPADRTRPGQVWQATVIPQDAREAGEPATASVQIENQAPTVDEVYIRPESAFEGSVLEAVIRGSDPDRDTLTYTTEWFINGVSQGVGSSVTVDGTLFDKGDNVAVQAVANDGLADSAPLKSAVVDILNTPPALSKAEITPTVAYEDTVLTCTPTGWSDADGDPEDYRFEWLVDGVVIGSSSTIDGAAFDKGDPVTCAVTPFDGTDAGRPQTARPVTIKNTPPELGSVVISPEDPESGTTITATPDAVYDLDGDTVVLDLDWFVDGRKVASGTTLPGGSYIKSQEIYVLATPNDGEHDGTPVKSNTVTSVNAPPTITSMAITPNPLFSDLAASVAIVTDDFDGDTVTLSYEWTINGTAYGTTSTTSVPSTETKRGDEVSVTVTTNDGDVDGDVATDAVTVKILLKPPGLTIDPEQPESKDDLFCEVTTETVDADGEEVSYVFSWTVDGVAYKGTTTTTDWSNDTIPSSATADGETWECEAYGESANGASEPATDEVIVGSLVPGFSGERGPTFAGYFQCEGYLDKSGGDEIPSKWADDCEDSTYTKIRMACGKDTSNYRYIDVKKNIFYELLSGYPESGLITDFKDQSGTSYSYSTNAIYGETKSGSKYDVQGTRSWWVTGSGCGETNLSLTINNVCTWEASNCFGQNLTGERYLWVYVAK